MMLTQLPSQQPTVTGAVIYVPSLVVVTLEDMGSGSFALCHDRSGSLTLEGRSLDEVRAFNDKLQGFLAERAITSLSLRSGAYRGQFLPGPPAFKIETMLQLAPALSVDLILKQSVTAWVNREDPSLPEATGRFGKNRWLTAEREAIEVAAYAVAHADTPCPSPAKERV